MKDNPAFNREGESPIPRLIYLALISGFVSLAGVLIHFSSSSFSPSGGNLEDLFLGYFSNIFPLLYLPFVAVIFRFCISKKVGLYFAPVGIVIFAFALFTDSTPFLFICSNVALICIAISQVAVFSLVWDAIRDKRKVIGAFAFVFAGFQLSFLFAFLVFSVINPIASNFVKGFVLLGVGIIVWVILEVGFRGKWIKIPPTVLMRKRFKWHVSLLLLAVFSWVNLELLSLTKPEDVLIFITGAKAFGLSAFALILAFLIKSVYEEKPKMLKPFFVCVFLLMIIYLIPSIVFSNLLEVGFSFRLQFKFHFLMGILPLCMAISYLILGRTWTRVPEKAISLLGNRSLVLIASAFSLGFLVTLGLLNSFDFGLANYPMLFLCILLFAGAQVFIVPVIFGFFSHSIPDNLRAVAFTLVLGFELLSNYARVSLTTIVPRELMNSWEIILLFGLFSIVILGAYLLKKLNFSEIISVQMSERQAENIDFEDRPNAS